jgi:hypothetical protein
VFLALPFITIVAGIADSMAWIAIPFVLMLAAQAAIWPLAFGAKTLEWYRQWKRTSNDIFSFRFLFFLARYFLEKCFGKQHAQWKRRQARIHAEEARALFEAVAALRQREGMPIASVIASYDNIVQRYGQNEAPAVREWVERALEEKHAILRVREAIESNP